jgi:hypothetical protein
MYHIIPPFFAKKIKILMYYFVRMAIFFCCTNTNFSLSKHIFENKKIHNTISKNGKKLAIENSSFYFYKTSFYTFWKEKIHFGFGWVRNLLCKHFHTQKRKSGLYIYLLSIARFIHSI